MIDWSQILQNIVYFISLYYVVFWLLVLLDYQEEKKKKGLTSFPELSIAIPAYNEEDNITPTIKSVVALDYPKEKISLFVIDDGSTDRTYARACAFMNEVNARCDYKKAVVLTQKNSGKYVAMNNALKQVKTDFFVTLDADSFPKKDCLKKLLLAFDDPKIAGASSILKVYKPKTMLQKIQCFEYAVNHFYKKLISLLDAIHVLPGPMSMYRTAALKKIGGFREAHKTEDMEVVLRLQKRQYKVVQCNDSFVYTKVPGKIKELYQQRHRWNYGSFKNVMDYSGMMFKNKYGDFGFFQLPMILVSAFLGLTLLGLILYEFLKYLTPELKILELYGFNIFSYLSSVQFNMIWLDADLKSIVTVLGFVILGLAVTLMSLRFYRERKSVKRAFPFVVYFFFYYLFLAVVWLGVFKDVLLRRGTRWDK